MKKIFVIFVILIGFSSCYYDNQEDLYGIECSTTDLTYSNQMEKVFSQSCATTGCHVSGNGIAIYDSYGSIMNSVDNGTIIDRVINKKNMPPSGALSDCDYSLINEWIKQGAKE